MELYTLILRILINIKIIELKKMNKKIRKTRAASITRKTKETHISVDVNVDGKGKYDITSPLPFMNHMLEQLSKHSLIDMKIKCKGDIEIDAHHTVEDLGWSIGGAINKAIEKRIGINRYYSISLPMDEALTICSVDISGRPWLEWRVILQNAKIGGIESEVFREFFQAFSQAAKLTLHIENKYGSNSHHVIESCFKALAICLKNSLTIDKENVDIIPSTKGKID